VGDTAEAQEAKKITLPTGTAEETDTLSMTATYIVTGQTLVDLIATAGLFAEESNSYISIPAGAI